MTVLSPAKSIQRAPVKSFVRVSGLPGTPSAARKAASRAAQSGDLLPIRKGLYYRGVKTKYGMTRPRIEEVARAVFGEEGSGPAGYSAAREWGVTTQVPASYHVATLWPVDPVDGITQYSRSNKERAGLKPKEIGLLELLRDPAVYVEAGWDMLVERVEESLSNKEIRMDPLGVAVAGERNVAVRENFERLTNDLAAA